MRSQMKTTDADSHLCKSEVEFYETTTTASILKWCKSNGAQKKPTKPKTLNNRQTAGLQTDCYWWPSATGWQETCCSCKFNPKGGRGDEVSYISFINMKMSFFFFLSPQLLLLCLRREQKKILFPNQCDRCEGPPRARRAR